MEVDWSLVKSRFGHYIYWFQTHPWSLYIVGVALIFLGFLMWNGSGSGAGIMIWIILGCIFVLAGMVCQFGFWG